MILNMEEYQDKVLGCWLGKNIGGTLGAPFEWRRKVNDVSFYTQDLGGEPLPNDDLDIQLLWLLALEERGVDIDAHVLAEYWTQYLTPHWAEYGTGKINMRSGLLPPLSGTFHNAFKDSCGCFIRSEIWACIAPGNPQLAARYAYEDGILDHGNGEGTYAEVFVAALESAAFIVSDIHKLIEIGLSYIPDQCAVTGAIKCALDCYHSGKTWREARDLMLKDWRGEVIYGLLWTCSQEDIEKGFHTGKRGWDVPSNIGMLLIGLLYGEGDFAKTLCTAVNCGEDTDCTGATVGSIFGILHGAKAVPQEWIAPIGRTIKTICLNIGELDGGKRLALDVDDLTARTMRIEQQVRLRQNPALALGAEPTNLDDVKIDSLKAGEFREQLYSNLGGPVFRFPDFEIGLDYGTEDPMIRNEVPRKVRLRIRNNGRFQANLALHWYLPEGWRVGPGVDGALLSLPTHFEPPLNVEFTFETPLVREPMNRAVLEITIPGRTTIMLIPVTLLNGNFM